jgi:hypothetical protein
MANAGLGMRSFLGFGEEVTWGTPVARTNFIEILNESITKNVGRIESQSILRRGIRNTHVVPGMVTVEGDIAFEATYDGWLKLAKHAFGAVASAQPDAGGSPLVYEHTFTLADTPPVGLTCEVFRDTSQFSSEPNKSFIYAGCKVSTFELACAVDEILKCQVSLVGKDEARGAKSTDTYGTAKVAVFHQGVIKWNGVDIEASSFSFRFDNGFGGRPKLGSQYSREPVTENKLEVGGSFEMDFESWDQYDDFVNTTEREFIAEFTGDTIQNAFKQMIKVTVPRALLHNVKVVLERPGRITVAADFKGYRHSSGTNEATMVVRNASATV